MTQISFTLSKMLMTELSRVIFGCEAIQQTGLSQTGWEREQTDKTINQVSDR